MTEVQVVETCAHTLALVACLDRMVERGETIPRTAFVKAAANAGMNGEKIVSGMLESGLWETAKVANKVVLKLTDDGMLAFIMLGTIV